MSSGTNAFGDIVQLLAHLEATHEPEVYVYRGQTRRYLHDWIGNDHRRIQLESLYPADFRFFARYSSPSQLSPADVSAARSYGRTVRDLFVSALMLRAGQGGPDYAWLAQDMAEFNQQLTALFSTPESDAQRRERIVKSREDISEFSVPCFRLFWSLAQHYLIPTALTDITFSPRVAAWFATQAWLESDPSPAEGLGVIYRFRRASLEEMLHRESHAMTDWALERSEPRAPELFFVDIRRVPVEFARRPCGQQGGSIFGFDQPKVLRALAESGCMEVFEFRHGPAAAALAGLRHEIAPKDDPFAPVADRIRTALEGLKPQGPRSESKTEEPVAAEARAHLGRLIYVARLAIRTARFERRVTLDSDFTGYYFTDIESTGHGYDHLLALINEGTNGLAGYVSSEPLSNPVALLPSAQCVLAMWVHGNRSVEDVTAKLDSESFLAKAVELAKRAFGRGAAQSFSSGVIEQRVGHAKSAGAVHKHPFLEGGPRAVVYLGWLLMDQSRFDEAEAVCRQAGDRGAVDVVSDLARRFFELGQLDRAEAAYRRALALGDREASYNLGTVFEAKQDWNEATRNYLEALERQGDRRAANNIAMVLLQQGKRDDAEKFLRIGDAQGDLLASENLRLLFKQNPAPEPG